MCVNDCFLLWSRCLFCTTSHGSPPTELTGPTRLCRYGRAPPSLGHGLVAYGGGNVLYRPFGAADALLCHMLDPVTLEPTRVIARPVETSPKDDSPSNNGGGGGSGGASHSNNAGNGPSGAMNGGGGPVSAIVREAGASPAPSPVRGGRPSSRPSAEPPVVEIQDLCFQVSGPLLYHVYMRFQPGSDPKKPVPVMVDTYDLQGAQSVRKVTVQLGASLTPPR